MSITITITAGAPQSVILQEGKTLNISANALAAGVIYRMADVTGSGNALQSWPVGASASFRIGPFPGTVRMQLSASAGSFDATMQDASLNTPPMVVSSAAPSNSDGMPDGTVYFQTV